MFKHFITAQNISKYLIILYDGYYWHLMYVDSQQQPVSAGCKKYSAANIKPNG